MTPEDTHRRLAYIRRTWGVPAYINGRVEYSGGRAPQTGTIIGVEESYLVVRLDGAGRRKGLYHPTWKLRYLDASPEALLSTKGLAAASLTVADPVKEDGR